jgi:hypothetical protein
MIRSAPATSSRAVVKCSRSRVASLASAVSLPFSTNLASDCSTILRPRSICSCCRSRAMTSKPAAAATWAMPLPMSPQPSTPTFLISLTWAWAFRVVR